jgi:hypothetical protein
MTGQTRSTGSRTFFSPFSAKEILTDSDFNRALALTIAILLMVLASSLISSDRGSNIEGGLETSLVQGGLAIAAAMIGVVLAAVAILVSYTDPRLLARMYHRNSTEFEKYIGVLFFPAKLALPTFAAALFLDVTILGLGAASPIPYCVSIVVLVLVLWELTSLYEAIAQIMRAMVTRAAHTFDSPATKNSVGAASLDSEGSLGVHPTDK